MAFHLRASFIVAVVGLLAAGACGRINALQPSDDASAGGPGDGRDAAPSCQGLAQSQCASTTGCSVEICPTCYGQTAFAACYRTGQTPPICIAPPCAPLTCPALNEVECNAQSGCAAEYCTGCQQKTYVGCGNPGQAFACPAICVAPPPCDEVKSLEACETRTDCHAVFVTEDNSANTHFARCNFGDQAMCRPAGLKGQTPPVCPGPTYVIAYVADGYEGCVKPKDCAP
jgi:hypothetical protein